MHKDETANEQTNEQTNEPSSVAIEDAHSDIPVNHPVNSQDEEAKAVESTDKNCDKNFNKNVVPEFTVGQRVKKTTEEGPVGTVLKVRIESVRDSIRTGAQESPGITVTVQWDNGTVSHFVPDGLAAV